MGVRLQWLLRTYLRATVLLAMAAGLSGGVALTAWLSGRRAEVAVSRYVERADPPELNVTFCAPGVTEVTTDELFGCFAYTATEATDELARLRQLPEVTLAARSSFQQVQLVGRDGPTMASVAAMADPGLATPMGTPSVLAGRLADPASASEITVNAAAAETYGLDVGDRIALRWLTLDDLQGEGDATGPQLEVEVVGIVRVFQDLASGAGQGTDEALFTGPGIWAATQDGAWVGFAAIQVQAPDAEAARTAVQQAFPGRPFNNGLSIGSDDIEPVDDAYGYEARAAMAFAVLTGLAALIFVGQAIARQVRREWQDLPTLRALGLSRRQASLTAAGRGGIVGLVAAVLAAVVAVALSPFTPIGTARAAEIDPGLRLDPLVLGLGLPLVAVLVTLVAWAPVWRLLSHTHRRARRDLAVPSSSLPPSGLAGMSMAVNGGRRGTGLPLGTAVAGSAFAVATIVAAMAMVASLDDLVQTPARYGAPWDVALSSTTPSPAIEQAAGSVATRPGVAAAGTLLGSELLIDGASTWTIALEPIDGADPIRPVITAGREPIRPNEIALGALSSQVLDKHIGDTVAVTDLAVDRQQHADGGGGRGRHELERRGQPRLRRGRDPGLPAPGRVRGTGRRARARPGPGRPRRRGPGWARGRVTRGATTSRSSSRSSRTPSATSSGSPALALPLGRGRGPPGRRQPGPCPGAQRAPQPEPAGRPEDHRLHPPPGVGHRRLGGERVGRRGRHHRRPGRGDRGPVGLAGGGRPARAGVGAGAAGPGPGGRDGAGRRAGQPGGRGPRVASRTHPACGGPAHGVGTRVLAPPATTGSRPGHAVAAGAGSGQQEVPHAHRTFHHHHLVDPLRGPRGHGQARHEAAASPTTTSRPPDDIAPAGTLTGLCDADGFRFANQLRAWIDVEDGTITGHGYEGGGLIGATTLDLGVTELTVPAVALPDRRLEPEVGDGWVRFTQTAGGRTGVPAATTRSSTRPSSSTARRSPGPRCS